MIQEQIAKMCAGGDIAEIDTEVVLEEILSGSASPVLVSAFLVALHMRGENAGQIAAAARVMRRHAVPVYTDRSGPVLDTCGTGGDGHGTFNISTLASLVVAACGVTVAKHGNRAASSRCGSADLLEELGVDLELSAERTGACIDEVGIGFMFARAYHPAMRHAAPVRTELAIPTLFNFLGPLSNPASATHQLLGVGNTGMAPLMADVLARLNIQRAWVVCGADGLDEVALAGPTEVHRVESGRIQKGVVQPRDFGVDEAPLSALQGGDAAVNAEIAREVLNGVQGPRADAVVVNAAASLCVAGKAKTPLEGADLARAALGGGRAAAKLAEWVQFTQRAN